MKKYFRFIFSYINFLFPGTKAYWERRYSLGGNSGSGSYGRLSLFKAEIVNDFVKAKSIEKIIEFGCGDGNQLSLIHTPQYVGFDISNQAIRNCIKRFLEDQTKSFFLFDPLCFCDKGNHFTADLTVSLDVIYHLVEKDIFESYMSALFGTSSQYVIIYSSNQESHQKFHEKHRCFTEWIESYLKEWKLVDTIANRYPYNPHDPGQTSRANFYIFQKSFQ